MDESEFFVDEDIRKFDYLGRVPRYDGQTEISGLFMLLQMEDHTAAKLEASVFHDCLFIYCLRH